MIIRTTLFLLALLSSLLLSAGRASAYYYPGAQRWLNRDPWGEDAGLNLFAFAENSPIGSIDTDGLSALRNIVRVCEQSGKLVRQIRQRKFEEAMEMTRETLTDMARHGEHSPIVHVPSSPCDAQRVGKALSTDGRLRARKGGSPVEQHGEYPPHVHPNDGPYKKVHVQSVHPHFPWRGALSAACVSTFAPTAGEAAESGDTGYFILAAAWDALTWVDPVGVTDTMEWVCGSP